MSDDRNTAGALGFVVIGRNEGERLEACLQSILSVTDRVIYADSASSDGSADVARRMGAHVVAVEGTPMSAARGRNTGFAELHRRFPELEFVHFIDGDCVLTPGWVERATSFLREHPQAAVVCGRRFEAHPHASFYNRVIDGEWDTPVGRAASCGGDALMRVTAFEAAGGFRSELIAGEEPDLCARLRAAGWEIWRLKAPMTRHDAAIYSLFQWMRRASRSGFGYSQVWSSGRGERLYGREIASALAWAAVLPLVVIGCAIIAREPLVLLFIPAAYALQAAKIAARKGLTSSFAWKYALLTMTAKLGEAWGVLRYLVASRAQQSFDYKRPQAAERPAA